MGKLGDFRLKINKLAKKRKKEIIIVFLIIWLIIFIWNMIEKSKLNQLPAPSTTYTPHVSVLDSEQEVPEKYQKPIEDLVEKYFNYCNNGEYEKAYNLITEDCRKSVYPTLDQFKAYIDFVFEGKKKIYNIQSYSIVDNKYIYNLRILDDILANGTTDGYYYYEEKIILTEENGEMKLAIAEYISNKKTNIKAEDDNMIVEITNIKIDYETETYTVKITNKTDKYIVISDNTIDNEIVLDLGEQTRKPSNMQTASFYVMPNGTTTETLVFNKFYDNGLTSQKLVLGSIRVLNEYNRQEKTTQSDLDSAVQLYGLEVNLK